MHKIIHALSWLACMAGLQAAALTDIQIVPKPESVRLSEGSFTISAATVIRVTPASPEIKSVAQYLAKLLEPATGFKLAVQSPAAAQAGEILIQLEAARADLGDEGYVLSCTPQTIAITAAKPAGAFYAIQTLRQLLPVQIENRQVAQGVTWSVPCVVIEDRPRFKWRGYLIDPARNFRSIDELKRYIDLLALHKLNTMQIHLTDDQGWRIEIKRYPKLVTTGSRLPDYTGRTGEGWSYSQAEIRELVDYAAGRYVTLVPEIEMPGHSGAVLAAYPEFACGGKAPGGWAAPLCVSQPSAFDFASQVLDEVVAMFPSPYIHIGADEVPAGPWRGCAKCKPLMAQLAVTPLPADVVPYQVKVTSGQGVPFQSDIGRLQGEFVRRIDRFLTTKQRRMVGWDEILEGGLTKGSNAVVMAWRGPSAVIDATARKQNVVVTLHPDYYLDNDTPLQRTYDYEPVPADLPADRVPYVLGVQGNMWGETTSSIQKVDARTFPRLSALAETGWTVRSNRNFADFSSRLTKLRQRLEILGVARQ